MAKKRIGVKFYKYGQRKSERGLSFVGVEGEIIERLSKAILGYEVYGTSVEYAIVPDGESYFEILGNSFIVRFDYEYKPDLAWFYWVEKGKVYPILWEGKRITRENIIRVIIKIMAREILGEEYELELAED